MGAPLVLHIIHRLEAGGLQNGLVNLINNLDPERYDHAIVCLEDATSFAQRLSRRVEVVELHKKPGKDVASYGRLARIVRSLRPAIVHTRNFGTLDTQIVAAACGVRSRIHGEHGRDVFDVEGNRKKFVFVRRVVHPLIHKYIAVSRDLERWLTPLVKARPGQVRYIANGVDSTLFRPGKDASALPPAMKGRFLIGTVGRMAAIKNQSLLADAYVHLLQQRADLRARIGLVLVGDGPLREVCADTLAEHGASETSWLPGERHDIPELMRALDVFVLPSIAEGMSNTILEAMACGIPVVATDVGGNRDLVIDGQTGTIVPSQDVAALAKAIELYVDNRERASEHGAESRRIVDSAFSLEQMVGAYDGVYRSALTPAAGE